MELKNNYFKVEKKIFYKNHIHIEKDFFRTKEEAEVYFSENFKELELGYLQSKYDEYYLALAECDREKNLTKIYKIRKAPY